MYNNVNKYFFCSSPYIHSIVGLIVKSRKSFCDLLMNSFNCECEAWSERVIQSYYPSWLLKLMFGISETTATNFADAIVKPNYLKLYKIKNYLRTNLHQVCFLPLFAALKLSKLSSPQAICKSRLSSFNLVFRYFLHFPQWREFMPGRTLILYCCGDAYHCSTRTHLVLQCL